MARERKRWAESEDREPLPASISDLWFEWAAGRLSFEEYRERAMAISQALAELEPEPGSSEDHKER